MGNPPHGTSAGIAIFLTLSAATFSASAQSVPIASAEPAVTANNETDNDLTEIIVTARRVEESQQSVPVTITAVTGEQLKEQQVQRLDDLKFLAPSLQVTGTGVGGEGAFADFSLRGVSRQLNTDVVVQSYLNEVPVTTIGLSYELYDMQSVQVLEGPQGVAFGKNSTGGAVLFQTQRPTNENDAWVEASVGNYDFAQVTGMINLPIVDDKLLLRIAADGQRRNGILDNVIGPDEQNRDHASARLSLSFIPSEKVRNDLVIDYFHEDELNSSYAATGASGGTVVRQVTQPTPGLCQNTPVSLLGASAKASQANPTNLAAELYYFAGLQYCFLSAVDSSGAPVGNIPGTPIPYFVGNGLPGGVPGVTSTPFGDLAYQNNLLSTLGPRTIAADPTTPEPGTSWGASDETQVNLGESPIGDLTVKDILGWRYSSVNAIQNYGPPIYVGLGGGSGGPTTNRTFTEELQLSGDVGHGALQWLVGAFYDYNTLFQGNNGWPTGAVFQTIPTPELNYLYDLSAGLITQDFEGNYANYKTNSVAGYARAIYEIFSPFSDIPSWLSKAHLTAGYRYTRDDQSASAFAGAMNFVDPTPSTFGPLAGIPRAQFQCEYAFPGGAPIVPAAAQVGSQINLNTCTRSGSLTTSAPSWEVGIDDPITSKILVYVKESHGYKAGGFNAFNTTNEFSFRPEFITAFEAGIKADWSVFDRPLRTNLTFYNERYTNIQTTSIFVNLSDGQVQSSIINQNVATIRGAEAQIQFVPFRGLLLTASYAYLDNFYTQFIDQSVTGTPPNYPSCSKTALADGNYLCSKIPFGGPSDVYTVGATYHLPTPEIWGPISLRADYYWQGANSSPNLNLGGGTVTQPAYDNVNASVQWHEVEGSKLDLTLWVKNLTNATGASFANNLTTLALFSSYSEGYALEPRLYGLTARYHFH
jgi:iron complex outermembrane receptor protein